MSEEPNRLMLDYSSLSLTERINFMYGMVKVKSHPVILVLSASTSFFRNRERARKRIYHFI